MIVDLRSVSETSQHHDLIIGSGSWSGDGDAHPGFSLAQPLHAGIDLTRTGEKFLVQGRISGCLTLLCDRCLEPFEMDVETGFEFYLSPLASESGEWERELSSRDLFVEFIAGDELELTEIVRGQVLLALPMVSICRPECAGLCPECGCNRNHEKCQCVETTGHSAFSKLRNFTIEGE